jgi:tRNA (guanine-N7-)-methyltransferase
VDWTLHYDRIEGTYANSNSEAAQDYPIDYSSDEVEQGQPVEIIDVGCGYGGLLFGLSKAFPSMRSLGLEIREKVANYVAQKIYAMRVETGGYQNIAILRTNAMKHFLNYISKAQLSKLFFCFADPHYKRSNHRRRIIK